MPATIRQIVEDSTELIGEVAGVGVQTYTEDQLRNHAIRGFNLLFKKNAWEQYRKWFRLSLDGTLGVVSTDSFESVLDFEDFIGVYRDAETKKLPILPKGFNPYTISGTQVNFYTSLHVTDANYAKRRLQFYPTTSVGFVNILARVYPLTAPETQFDWEDTFYLDRDLLVYATSFMALIVNSLNADAAATCKSLMEGRYADIIAGLSDHPIPISTNPTIPRAWGEAPYP
jgi:hypothetical protein